MTNEKRCNVPQCLSLLTMSPPQNKTVLPAGREMMYGDMESSEEEVSNRVWALEMCEYIIFKEENAIHLFFGLDLIFFYLLRSQFNRILFVSFLHVLLEVFCLLVC